MLGLIANNFVRVYHPCSSEHQPAPARLTNLDDRRRDPGDQPLLHRRQLQLRQPARDADRRTARSRRSSAARSAPRRRRHRLPEELQLRRPPPLPRAAQLHRADRIRLGHRARDDRLSPQDSGDRSGASMKCCHSRCNHDCPAQLTRKKENTLVGLEIEAGSVAATEVRANGSAELIATAIAPLPPEAFQRRRGRRPRRRSPRRCARSSPSTSSRKRVRLGIANQRVVVRTLRLPAIDDPEGARGGGPLPGPGADPDAARPGGARPPGGRRRPRQPRDAAAADRRVVVAARRDMIAASLAPAARRRPASRSASTSPPSA